MKKVIKKDRRRFIPIEDYFSNPNTERSAYWAGFIAADGCIVDYTNRQHTVKIGLSNIDTSHLEKLNIGIPVRLYRNECWVEIPSNKIVKDLLKYNITPRKSLTLLFPTNIRNKYIHHFIRGYIDGDGCMSKHSNPKAKNKLRIRILGTEIFLNSLLGHIKLDINRNLCKRGNGTLREAIICKNSHQLYQYLYKDATIYLDRKKEKAEYLMSL